MFPRTRLGSFLRNEGHRSEHFPSPDDAIVTKMTCILQLRLRHVLPGDSSIPFRQYVHVCAALSQERDRACQ